MRQLSRRTRQSASTRRELADPRPVRSRGSATYGGCKLQPPLQMRQLCHLAPTTKQCWQPLCQQRFYFRLK
jgi:hypothetical protein